jgi:phage terminase large subunit
VNAQSIPYSTFDFANPDYAPVVTQRIERLSRIRAKPAVLADLSAYYRDSPAQFITDWGVTYDPRNPESGLPASVPFVLFDRQCEMIDYIMGRWRAQGPGLIEKSRDVGASWLVMALAVTLCTASELIPTVQTLRAIRRPPDSLGAITPIT